MPWIRDNCGRLDRLGGRECSAERAPVPARDRAWSVFGSGELHGALGKRALERAGPCQIDPGMSVGRNRMNVQGPLSAVPRFPGSQQDRIVPRAVAARSDGQRDNRKRGRRSPSVSKRETPLPFKTGCSRERLSAQTGNPAIEKPSEGTGPLFGTESVLPEPENRPGPGLYRSVSVRSRQGRRGWWRSMRKTSVLVSKLIFSTRPSQRRSPTRAGSVP